MPWPFFIPEFLKKRACRYLLHHYLGQFLEERISLNDLSLDLYNGTGTVTNLPLNVEIINESLEEVNAPVRVVSGFVGRVTVTVPWTSLMSSSCTVMVSGLTITVTPHTTHQTGGQNTMTDSLFFSMGNSRQMAEEVLRGGEETGEKEEETGSGFEGMEALTRAIETVLLRVQISLTDTTINISYSPPHDHTQESVLSFKVDRIEFFDEVTKQQQGDSEDGQSPLAEFTTKMLQLSGLSLEVGVVNLSANSHLIGSLSDFPEPSDEESEDLSRCSVPVACASGEVTVKVKIKKCDSAAGPKLDVDMFVGVVHLLLSPQQLNTVLEMVIGLGEGAGGGGAGVARHGHNRPIPQQAMRNIETQLQQHIDQEQRKKIEREETLRQDPWEFPAHGNSSRGDEVTESLFDTTDQFRSFESHQVDEQATTVNHDHGQHNITRPLSRGNIFGRVPSSHELSDIELTKGVGLQQFSLSPSASPSQLRRQRSSVGGGGGESDIEICRYSLTVGGVTCVLLEANPVHTHSTASHPDSQPTSLGSSTEYCSLDESGLDPVKYFCAVGEVLKGGVSRAALQANQEELGQILPADHLLLWMSSVHALSISQGSTGDVEITTGSLELWEYLYRNEANLTNITSPVSIQPLVQFAEEGKGSQPCMRMSCKWGESSLKKTANTPDVSIETKFNHAQLYLDVTLLDRLHPLLHPPPATSRHDSLPATFTQNFNFPHTDLTQQALFQQALSSETYSSLRQRVNVKLLCSSVELSLRFPVSDLSGTFHPPWYRTPLRTETLFVIMDELTISSTLLLPSTLLQSTLISTQFEQAKFYLSLDGSKDSKQLFLTIGPNYSSSSSAFPFNSKKKSLDTASIRVTLQSFADSSLEETTSGGMTVGNTCGSPTDDFMMDMHASNPSPFSHKRTLYSSSTKGLQSEELVLPGTIEEMTQFESHASSTARYSISASLPCVCVHIPSKKFLETLYNRFANDLLLWEPASPAAVEKATARSMFYSCMDMLQPAVSNQDKFKLCKSVLEDAKEDDEDEQEEESLPRDETVSRPSLISVSLSVGKGLVSLNLPVKTEGESTSSSERTNSDYKCEEEEEEEDERLLDLSPRPAPIWSSFPNQRDHGLIAIDTSHLHVFLVSDYHGEAARMLACARLQELSVGHCGSVQQAGLSSLTSLSEGHSLVSQLRPLIYPSAERTNQAGSGGDYWLPSDQEPMLALALDSRTESDNKRKVNKCAVMLQDTTLQHYTTTGDNDWMQQLGELFTLKDEAVKGFTSLTTITELHTHLYNCAIEYIPVYLSAHAVVALTSVSFTSSLVTGSPLLVLRVVLDRTQLFLSNKKHRHVNLNEGFVCVMEIGLFDLVLRLCNKTQESDTLPQLFVNVPEVDLQCSGTDVHFWLCVDSCSLLRSLLLYLAENRDVIGPPQAVSTSPSSVRHPTTSAAATSNGDQSPPSPPPSYEADPIGDLISEAMKEPSLSPPAYRSLTSSTSTSVKDGEMEVSSMMQGSLEDTLTKLIFESDEEDEAKETTRKRHEKKSRPSHSKGEDDDDDGFCILDAPTTAKVGPSAVPVVKCLLDDEEDLTIIDDHFVIPDGRTDQLRRPKHFPNPVTVYTLKELTITWHLYGGADFSSSSPSTVDKFAHQRHTGPAAAGKMAAGGAGKFSSLSGKGRERKGKDSDEGRQGGLARDHDVLMEIELSKLRIQHEVYPSDATECSRLVVLLRDMEIRDRLVQSRINKFLYQYSTDIMPRQTHANILSLKMLLCRPEPDQSVSSQPLEASVRVSLLPLRLNVDQDAVFFLYDFFQRMMPNETDSTINGDSFHTKDVPLSSTPVDTRTPASTDTAPSPPSVADSTDVFIKSFVFSPEVPIRIDYEAKWFHSEQVGTLTGILLGLGHLDNSEVTLKAISYKQGVLGWGSLIELVANEWAQDIKKYQLPRILKGVGPMYHVTQLVQGVVDLFWLPVQQYQEDGRVLWGIQRGASSFATSSGVAVVELTNRLLQSVQGVAETAYGMAGCNGGGSQAVGVPGSLSSQPADVREGLANAYNVVTTGIGDTAWDLYQTAAHEHDERGVSAAVGGVLRHIPGTIVRPVIFASEATRHVLGGVKNQFLPEARKDASDKWKNDKT